MNTANLQQISALHGGSLAYKMALFLAKINAGCRDTDEGCPYLHELPAGAHKPPCMFKGKHLTENECKRSSSCIYAHRISLPTPHATPTGSVCVTHGHGADNTCEHCQCQYSADWCTATVTCNLATQTHTIHIHTAYCSRHRSRPPDHCTRIKPAVATTHPVTG